MNDDLQSVSQSLLHLQKKMEQIRPSFQLLSVDFYEQIERSLRPIRQHHLKLTRMAAAFPDPASAGIFEVAKANQHCLDMIDKATASTRVFADLTRTHESWLRNINPMYDQIAQLQAQTKLSLCGMAHRLTVSERLLAGIDFEGIRKAIAPHELAIAKLQDTIMRMTANYRSLVNSIHSYPDFAELPAYALPGATREVFVTSYAVDVLQPPTNEEVEDDPSQLVLETEEETSVCVALLQKIDPALVTPYAGARDALQSANPDRTRHILSSLREFWTHLLHRLAPDDQVLAWVPRDETGLLHEGRPTRQARVLYICRDLNHMPLSNLVVQDTKALVELLDLFNRVHQLKPELTDEQLRALLLRTDSWLTYILNIWEEGGSK